MDNYKYDSEYRTEERAAARCKKLQTEGYVTKIQKWHGMFRVYFKEWRKK